MIVRELITKLGFSVDDSAIKAFETNLQSISEKAKDIGSKLTLGLTVPLTAAGVGVFKLASDFEQMMAQVAINADLSGEALDKVEKQIRQVGFSTQFSASQAAEAYNELVKGGMSAVDASAALSATVDFAGSTLMGMGTAAGIVGKTLGQFELPATDAQRVADALAKAANTSKVEVADLAESLKYAGPVAKAAGLSLEETLAGIVQMGNVGIEASQAGTTLRAAMVDLFNPTKKAQEVLNRLGVSIKDANDDTKVKNLFQVIKELKEAGANEGDLAKIFGTEAVTGIIALTKQTDGYADVLKSVSDNAGFAKKQNDALNSGAKGAWMQLTGAIEELAIAIGKSGFLEFVTKVINGLANIVTAFSQLNPEVLKWITIIAAAAAAIGPLLIGLSFLLKMIAYIRPAVILMASLSSAFATAASVVAVFSKALLMSPLTWYVVGIAGILAGLYALYGFFTGQDNFMVKFFREAWEYVSGFFSSLTAGYDKVKSLFGMGDATVSVDNPTQNMSNIMSQTPASSIAGSMAPPAGSQSSVNISSSYNIEVPPGTTADQQRAIEETMKKVNDDHQQQIMRSIQNAQPALE